MRLIDADETVETLYACIKLHKNYATLYRPFETGYVAGLENAVKILKSGTPAIEAEPVRHGYWIPVDGGDTCDEWECSACGKWMVFQYDMDYDDMCEEFPRCPKCGAKMDGDPS